MGLSASQPGTSEGEWAPRAAEPVRSEIPIDLVFGKVNAVIAGPDAIGEILCERRIGLSDLIQCEPDPLGNGRTGPRTVRCGFEVFAPPEARPQLIRKGIDFR